MAKNNRREVRLKPCPNCRSKGDHLASIKEMDRANTYCIVCGMQGPTAINLVFSWKAWNKLPRRDPLARQKDGVVKMALVFCNSSHGIAALEHEVNRYERAKRSRHGKK